MGNCIYCRKKGKKICDVCVENIKKDKLNYIFPLDFQDIGKITDICNQKSVEVEASTTIQEVNGVVETKNGVEKSSVEKTEQKAAKENAKSSSIYDSYKALLNEYTSNQTDKTVHNDVKTEQTNTDFVSETSVEEINSGRISSNKEWVWYVALAISALAISIVGYVFLPQNIAQWIYVIAVAFYLIGIICDIRTEGFISSNIALLLFSGVNIYHLFSDGWSRCTFVFVLAIVLAFFSLVVTAVAYYKKKYGTIFLPLLCLVVNVCVIFWDKIFVFIEQFMLV